MPRRFTTSHPRIITPCPSSAGLTASIEIFASLQLTKDSLTAVTNLPDALLKNIDILIPNQREINVLCPEYNSLEKQAEYFLKKGVGTVIITLGPDGCYLKTKEFSQYFKASDFQPLDETGAADAFIAALAVYLQKDYSISNAIQIATYAAGFSISREGVVPALIDLNTLGSTISLREPQLLKSTLL